MNDFENQVAGETRDGLYSVGMDTLQVNLGFQCNQQCSHCHVEASPLRTEMMNWTIMELILKAAGKVGCQLVDLTGGAPELNPYFRRFVSALRLEKIAIQVRNKPERAP